MKAKLSSPFDKSVQYSVQHQAAPACIDDKVDLISQEKGHLHVTASQCNPVQIPQVPPLGLGESVKPSGRMSDSASTDTNMTQFEAVVNSFQALSAEDQLSLIWKLLSLRSTSEAEGELGAIAKVKTTIMQ